MSDERLKLINKLLVLRSKEEEGSGNYQTLTAAIEEVKKAGAKEGEKVEAIFPA